MLFRGRARKDVSRLVCVRFNAGPVDEAFPEF